MIVCAAGDDLTLLLRERWECVELDPIAGRIWALLAQPRTTTELVALLCAEYDVPAERCQAEIESLLTSLFEAGALECAGRPEP